MHQHVSDVCASAYIELRRISSIRQSLSCDGTKTLIFVIVFSKLDYSNSLLAGAPKNLTDKLQRALNAAASRVVQCRRRHQITPIFHSFNGFQYYVEFSIRSRLCHCSLSECGPNNLSELPQKYKPSHQLHSFCDSMTLSVLTTNKKAFWERSFSFPGPTVSRLTLSINSTPALRQALETSFQELFVPS